MQKDHNELATDPTSPFPGLQPIEVLTPAEIGNLPGRLEHHTPLWFYVLKESEVRTGGKTLGPVGGRIVAEVLIGLLELDKHSFLNASPLWAPTLAGNDDFKMTDLLTFAEVVRPAAGPPPNQPWAP